MCLLYMYYNLTIYGILFSSMKLLLYYAPDFLAYVDHTLCIEPCSITPVQDRWARSMNATAV